METESKKYLIDIESNLKEYADQAAAAKKKVDELKASNDELKKTGTPAEIEAGNAALRNAQKEYNQAKKMVDLHVNALNSEAGSRKQLGEILKIQEQQLGKLGNAYIKNKNGIMELNPAYVNQRNKIADTKKAIIDYDRALNDGRSNIGRYGESLKQALGGMVGITSASAAMIITFNKFRSLVNESINDFANFQRGQLNVQSNLDKFDVTLQSRTLELMKKYGLSIDDVNKALFDATSAGVPAAESTRFLGEATQLAIAGVSDLTTATDALTTIINAYGLSYDETGKIADAFFTAQKYGKVTVEELASAIGDGIPMAKLAGVSYQEFLAGVAELTRLGIKADESVTILKNTIKQLVSPTKDAKEAFKSLGIETGIVALKNNGLFETMAKIQAAAKGNEDVISELIPEIRALTGVATFTNDKLAEYDMILKDVYNDTGEASSMTRAFNSHMESVAKQTEIVSSKLSAAKVEFGQAFAPIALWFKNDMAESISNVAQSLRNVRVEIAIVKSWFNKEARADLENTVREIMGLQKTVDELIIYTPPEIKIDTGSTEFISKEDKEAAKKALVDKKRAEDKMEQAKKQLQKELDDYKEWIRKQKDEDEKNKERQKKDADELAEYKKEAQLRNQENMIAIEESNDGYIYSIQRKRLEQQRQEEVENAKKTGESVHLINAKYAALQRQIDRAEHDAKLQLYSDFAGNLATIFGEHTAIGKAAAIAQTTISTYAAAQKAYEAYAEIPPLAVLAAASAVAAGIANVQKIMSVSTDIKSTPSSISSSSASQHITAPSVGATILQPQLSQSQLNALPNTGAMNAKDFATEMGKEFEKLPAPIVTVEDINAKTSAAKKVEVRANI